MAGPVVNATPIATGGAIRLDMPEYVYPPAGVTDMVISTATSGTIGLSPWLQIYSGATYPVWLDVGDLRPLPLDPATLYVYQVSDSRGTTQTDPVMPSWTCTPTPDQLTALMVRLIQGAVNAMPLLPGMQKTQVTTRMPMNGWQAMPFIIVSPELVQQTEVQIGEDVPTPDQHNNWTMFALVNRVWRITIMSVNDEERDFYRERLLVAFRVFKAQAFAPLGYDVTHRFQAVSYTDSHEWEGHVPGFYAADLMYELEGVFPVVVLTNYGLIETISTTENIYPPPGTEGSSITANVPNVHLP
jgi:hypothetical protein